MIDINPQILIIQLVTFLAGLWIIWKFFIGPLTKRMEQRQLSIKQNIESAEKMKSDIQQLKSDYEKQLAGIEQKATEIINSALQQGQLSKEEIIKQAQEQAKFLLQKTQEQLQSEKSVVMKQIHNQVAELSVLIAEKILEKSVDKAVQDRLLNEIVNELKS